MAREGFVIEQLLTILHTRNAYFWATHAGAELDLLVFHHGRRLGFECKHADAPAPTKSMHIAVEDLQLDQLWVLYPGRDRYSLDEKITAFPACEIPALVAELNRERAA